MKPRFLARVAGRPQWIAREWLRCAPPPTPETSAQGYDFFPTETHWYLGRAYRLRLRPLLVLARVDLVSTEEKPFLRDEKQLPLSLSLFALEEIASVSSKSISESIQLEE